LLNCFRLPEDDYTIGEVALVSARTRYQRVLLESGQLATAKRRLRRKRWRSVISMALSVALGEPSHRIHARFFRML